MLVRELLELPVLRDAGVRVLTGEQGLEREVRWAHAGEIADIARYLTGGEALLTAATGLIDATRADRRRYIRGLAAAGVAIVLVELGRTFREIPDEMVEEARKGGLTLAEILREVPFVAVTQAVHTSIVDAQHRTVARAVEIGDAINQLVLDGASVPELLDSLAGYLGNPVILEDGSHRVVAFSRSTGTPIAILQRWRQHSRQGHDSSISTSGAISQSQPRCAWGEVTLRGERWGRLHVMEANALIDETMTLLAVGRVSAAVAFSLLADRGPQLDTAQEDSLIRDVVAGTYVGGEDFLNRAAGLGVDLGDELVVLVVGVPRTGARFAAVVESVKLDTVRAVMRAVEWPSVWTTVDAQAIGVASALPPGGLASTLHEIAERFAEAGLSRAHIGASRPARAAALPRSLGEAQTAWKLGPSTESSPIHDYADLALYRLLAPILHGPELANFVESELGPLIAGDDRLSLDLIETLDAFLRCNGSKTATAEALHLQRRSVYYRLDRIERLLQRPLQDPEQRVRWYIALRAREMLDLGR
jgi:purine catabolism regulator